MSRVLHVAESFSGGVADFVLHLASNLPHHHHTVLYGVRDRGFVKENLFDRFPPDVHRMEWMYATREIHLIKDLKALRRLMQIMKAGKYDVVHLHSSKAGFLGRVAGLFHRKSKILYTTHCIAFLRRDVSVSRQRIFVALEWLASKLPGLVIGCSPSESDAIQKYGIQCTYISNAIPNFPFPAFLASVGNNRSIVTIGRITAQKGPEQFNTLAKSMLHQTDVSFIWIGDGDDRSLLTSPNIHVTGWLKKEEVYSIVSKASVYVSNALWEGLPLAVLEAMKMQLPLVLRACTGNVDCVEQGVNGFLFEKVEDAAQYCHQLLDDPSKATEMGIRSVEVLNKKFNFQTFLQAYDRLYEVI
ncbi:MAG: glycosyltransferase [Sediminibacterium sp.]|jgi:glycosyltransferase involved in cell wall biosynthesis|nr:glycosyltransferase [Sediminibacterium sp.]